MINIEEKFNSFIEAVSKMVSEKRRKSFPSLPDVKISFTSGKKYWKVIREEENGNCRSSYCFVDKSNGDILKAATWNRPAKHARGNIFDENPLNAVSEYGANYLR